MKFLPSAAELFPEIGLLRRGTDQNGHPFAELLTQEVGISIAQECQIDSLVFLRRSSAVPASIVPVDSHDALERLIAELPMYEQSVHQAHRRSLELLSRLRTFELHYDRLDDAIGILNHLAESFQ